MTDKTWFLGQKDPKTTLPCAHTQSGASGARLRAYTLLSCLPNTHSSEFMVKHHRAHLLFEGSRGWPGEEPGSCGLVCLASVSLGEGLPGQRANWRPGLDLALPWASREAERFLLPPPPQPLPPLPWHPAAGGSPAGSQPPLFCSLLSCSTCQGRKDWGPLPSD